VHERLILLAFLDGQQSAGSRGPTSPRVRLLSPRICWYRPTAMPSNTR